jgi:hypothetical protein
VTPSPPAAVAAHLAHWVGAWPPRRPALVVADPTPDLPGWDGGPRGVLGVAGPDGAAVLRLPAEAAGRMPPVEDVDALVTALPSAMALPGIAGRGVLRWAVAVPGPGDLADAGVWLPAKLGLAADPRVPAWLVPFGGEVLVALDGQGRHLAGVGLKKHDDLGQEIAVVTAEWARGRGLARRLVAQAARRVLAEGRVVTYLHGPDNVASARVADACGFPDQGWSVLGFWSPNRP